MAKKYLVISSNNQISLTDHLTGEATQAASVVFEVKTMLDAVTIDIVKVADGRKLNLVKEEEPAPTSTPIKAQPNYRLGCQDDDGRPVNPDCTKPGGSCGCGIG